MQDDHLRAAKEAFVTGHSGASKLEILCLTACMPLCIWLGELLKASKGITGISGLASWRMSLPHALPGKDFFQLTCLEFVVTILPLILLCMGCLPWPHTTLCLVLATVLWPQNGLLACVWQMLTQQQQRHTQAASMAYPCTAMTGHLTMERKGHISVLRGGLMLFTCIAILAVDFHAFPRRLAKAETYGTGLMDVGVGGVVFTSGLISPALRMGQPLSMQAWARGVLQGVRGAAVCWALAVARLLSTAALGYQEHVGEYGVHWNFFCTIAVVALLGAIVRVQPQHLPALALTLTVCHQTLLSYGGVGHWIMSGTRAADLLSLNKEGLGSCLGYWALYLWGAATAHVLHTSAQRLLTCTASANVAAGEQDGDLLSSGTNHSSLVLRKLKLQPKQEAAAREANPMLSGQDSLPKSVICRCSCQWKLLAWLGLVAAVDMLMWLCVYAMEQWLEPVSRRSCNAPYIVWITALLLACMLPLIVGQALLPSWQPCLPMAANASMLALFLAANIATGLVNMSTNTLAVTDYTARLAVGMYMFAVSLAAVSLQLSGVRLKL